TNLARRASSALAERAVLDDGPADARADEDADQVVVAHARAELLLAVGGHLHVVAEHDGQLEALREQLRNGEILHVRDQVRRREQHPGHAVHLAGDADADRFGYSAFW